MSKKLGSFAVAAIASGMIGSAQPSIAAAAGQPQWVLDYETGKVTVLEPGSKEQMLMQYVDQIQNQVMQAVVDVSECGPCWLRMLLDEGGHVVKVAEGLDDAAEDRKDARKWHSPFRREVHMHRGRPRCGIHQTHGLASATAQTGVSNDGETDTSKRRRSACRNHGNIDDAAYPELPSTLGAWRESINPAQQPIGL